MKNNASVTQLLEEYRHGDGRIDVLPDLFHQVYSELRQIAAREHRRVWNADTINTSALINEAFLKLASQENLKLENRAHFFAVSAMAMRHILVNYLEQKRAKKRGGDLQRVTMVTMANSRETEMAAVLGIDRALKQLKDVDEKLASLVEMRFFAGMTEIEIAEVMGSTERTVRRNWRKAKALLQQMIDNAE